MKTPTLDNWEQSLQNLQEALKQQAKASTILSELKTLLEIKTYLTTDQINKTTFDDLRNQLQNNQDPICDLYASEFDFHILFELQKLTQLLHHNRDYIYSEDDAEKQRYMDWQQQLVSLMRKHEAMARVLKEMEVVFSDYDFDEAKFCLDELKQVYQDVYLTEELRKTLQEYQLVYVSPDELGDIEDAPLLLQHEIEQMEDEEAFEIALPQTSYSYAFSASSSEDFSQVHQKALEKLEAFENPLWSYESSISKLKIKIIELRGDYICKVLAPKDSKLTITLDNQEIHLKEMQVDFVLGNMISLQSEPNLKIWLDDQLVFSKNLKISSNKTANV